MEKQIKVDHPLFERLGQIDEEATKKFPTGRLDSGLMILGLGVFKKVAFRYYDWCTPINCWAFATTGGDGVHFSFLAQNEQIDETSPVVITTPADMGQSLIVGENLFDFLCLGWHRSYFCLASIKSANSTLEEIIDPNWYPGWQEESTDSNYMEYPHYYLFPPSEELQKRVFSFLVEKLNLKPWTDSHHLAELNKRYAKLLELPPEFPKDEVEGPGLFS
jgi:hypothetical protein